MTETFMTFDHYYYKFIIIIYNYCRVGEYITKHNELLNSLSYLELIIFIKISF